MLIIHILKETEILSFYRESTAIHYFIGLCITYLLLTGTIVLGVWFSTRKAVNMPPAEALRDE